MMRHFAVLKWLSLSSLLNFGFAGAESLGNSPQDLKTLNFATLWDRNIELRLAESAWGLTLATWLDGKPSALVPSDEVIPFMREMTRVRLLREGLDREIVLRATSGIPLDSIESRLMTTPRTLVSDLFSKIEAAAGKRRLYFPQSGIPLGSMFGSEKTTPLSAVQLPLRDVLPNFGGAADAIEIKKFPLVERDLVMIDVSKVLNREKVDALLKLLFADLGARPVLGESALLTVNERTLLVLDCSPEAFPPRGFWGKVTQLGRNVAASSILREILHFSEYVPRR